MPRKKNYDVAEVTEKAMHLFWSNGYSTTSARMLQNRMGINLFSIYASFENKDGVFLASIKSYKNLIRKALLIPLSTAPQSPDSIKHFFYNFLDFTKEKNQYRGCLLINTINELGQKIPPKIANEVQTFSEEIMRLFHTILAQDSSKSTKLLLQQTNYLMVALQGIMLTAKALPQLMIDDYIELIFQRI